MKKSWMIAALALVAAAGTAPATPLRMDYCVTPNGGVFDYKIELVLDNNDGSWVAGQGFGWIIFGDIQGPATSPINDFIMDPSSFPIGPFIQLQGSGGGHNGPTLGPVVINIGTPTNPNFVNNLWIPNAIGDKLEWKGSSATNLPAGQMLWSNLMSGPGQFNAANWAVAEISCSNPCYPDCNGDGVLLANDFGCFQTKFVQGDMYADCNGDGFLTAPDFGCFQTKFVAGCP